MLGRHDKPGKAALPGAITPGEIEALIEAALPGAQVKALDMTGTADHYDITVISKAFTGKSLIEQHRMIFGILSSEMDRRIHAVQLKTRTE